MQPIEPYLPPGGSPPGPNAQSRVNLPAILIIAAQMLGLLVQLTSLMFKAAIQAMVRGYMESIGKPLPAGSMDSNPILTVLGILGGIFVVYAMLEMRKLKSFPIVVAGTILAMSPIGSLCCCFGLPIGIWALVVLFDPEVRAAFT